MKVIIDTNVLIAIIPSKSKYHFVYQQIKTNGFDVILSSEILLEYEEQLKFRYKFPSGDEELESFVAYDNVEFITVDFFWNLITHDPDDNKFVDCAVASNADYIVTNDKHFDVLHTITFPKVNTLTLQQFIELLTETRP